MRSTRKPINNMLSNPADRFAKKLQRLQQSKRDSHNAKVDRLGQLKLGHEENAHKLDLTFSPLEQWLDTVEKTAEIDVLSNGLAIFQPDPKSGDYYPVAEALEGVCETYQLIAIDQKIPDQTSGLMQLAKKIGVGMMLFASDMSCARETIKWMRAIAAEMTPNQFSNYSLTVQIRAEFCGKGIA